MALTVRPAEWLLVGYSAVVIVTATARADHYPAAIWAAVAHGLIVVLVGLFVTAPADARLARWLREGAPIVLLLALYGSIDLVNGFGAEPTRDPLVRRWEIRLFGTEPARLWWQRTDSSVASSVFHAAYLSYYLIVPVPVAVFLRRGHRAALARTGFGLLIAFLACYLAAIFFPVAGPYYEYPRPDAWFLDNLPARAVYGVLAGGSSYGAAFPSSHVAAAWAAALVGWAGDRRLGAALAIGSAALTVSVVYCQMHYVVDALAGLLVAAGAGVAALLVYPTARRTARDS